MKQIVLHNRKFTIRQKEDSIWIEVFKNGVLIDTVISDEDAYQSIRNDLQTNGFDCKFLTHIDFSGG